MLIFSRFCSEWKMRVNVVDVDDDVVDVVVVVVVEWEYKLFFLKRGPITASFLFICVFSTCYNLNSNLKKCRWCAWDSNSGQQDGRRERIHWATVAPQGIQIVYLSISVLHRQSDQTGSIKICVVAPIVAQKVNKAVFAPKSADFKIAQSGHTVDSVGEREGGSV